MTATPYHRGLSEAMIVKAGLQLGLDNLSINAVAHHLGVSGPAIYRHVGSRDELEILVADEILQSVSLRDPGESMREFLIRFAQELFRICADDPGMSEFLHIGFPRGEQARRIQREVVQSLRHWGISPEVADLLAGTIAVMSLSLSYADRITRQVHDSSEDVLVAVGEGPPLSGMERFTLIITPCIDGYVELVRPGMDARAILTRIYQSLPAAIATDITQTVTSDTEDTHG